MEVSSLHVAAEIEALFRGLVVTYILCCHTDAVGDVVHEGRKAIVGGNGGGVDA